MELKKKKQVTENLELVPISIYNKTKMIAENVLMSYNDKIKFIVLDQLQYVGYHQE